MAQAAASLPRRSSPVQWNRRSAVHHGCGGGQSRNYGIDDGLKSVTFKENTVAGAAANVAITSGNNQTAIHGTQLPQALSVLVTDQYGNPFPATASTFRTAGLEAPSPMPILW